MQRFFEDKNKIEKWKKTTMKLLWKKLAQFFYWTIVNFMMLSPVGKASISLASLNWHNIFIAAIYEYSPSHCCGFIVAFLMARKVRLIHLIYCNTICIVFVNFCNESFCWWKIRCLFADSQGQVDLQKCAMIQLKAINVSTEGRFYLLTKMMVKIGVPFISP